MQYGGHIIRPFRKRSALTDVTHCMNAACKAPDHRQGRDSVETGTQRRLSLKLFMATTDKKTCYHRRNSHIMRAEFVS